MFKVGDKVTSMVGVEEGRDNGQPLIIVGKTYHVVENPYFSRYSDERKGIVWILDETGRHRAVSEQWLKPVKHFEEDLFTL